MDILIKEEIRITHKDEKTNLTLPFYINEEAGELVIRFSYSPKTLEDIDAQNVLIEENLKRDAGEFAGEYTDWKGYYPLKNLVTLSLDSPSDFIGAAHRQDREQEHIINEIEASRGFIPCKIEKGTWVLSINVHAVVTDECILNVEVLTRDRKSESFWHPCELHCHTLHSDGKFTVPELIETAKNRGLEGICLTDHNTVSGHREAVDSTLAILKGIEWTTYHGHMLALDVGKYVDWRQTEIDTIDEKMEEVHALGGLCGIAHPFQIGTPICTGGRWDYRIKDFNNVNYMEIWSEGSPYMNTSNKRAYSLWCEKLDMGLKIAPTFGRDWHSPINNKLLCACTYLLTPSKRLWPEDMKAAIKGGKTQISKGVFLHVDVDGKTIGDTISAGEHTVWLSADYSRMQSGLFDNEIKAYRVKIISNNQKVIFDGEIDKELTTQIKLGGGDYIRFELWGSVDGEENMLIALTGAMYCEY